MITIMDSSIYGALVNMAQPWSTRYPLVDGHGNFGSIDGDGAAAMRYTEARLSKVAREMLSDINANTVDFMLNFDESEKEPKVLPSRIPNIFLNGTTGIAVGMASHTVPYNLNEIVAGITAFLKNRDISMEEMMQFVPSPDFPTGGEIINQGDLYHVMSTGVGAIKIRAKYEIEEGKKSNYLVFTEVPYEVNKTRLIENIVDRINDGTIAGISNVVDESDKKGIRIVFELKKGMLPDAVAQQLYKLTDLQTNFNLRNTMLINGVPRENVPFLTMMKEYCDFQMEVLTRRTKTDKSLAEDRLEIVKGLLIALENVDDIVSIIKGSKTKDEAVERLISEYSLTERQAEAIMDIKLRRLVSMEKMKVEEEKNELIARIDHLSYLLSNEDAMTDILISELNEISSKYSDVRRTRLSNLETTSLEDLLLIAQEDIVVNYSEDGYIKGIKLDQYKTQNRGGAGINNSDSVADTVIFTNTAKDLLVVTEQGTVFKLPVRNIPHYKNSQKGISIHNLLPNLGEEKICSIVDMSEIHKQYIVFVTKYGTVKKSSTELYKKFRANGTKGITLREGDSITNILFVDDSQLLTLFTSYGKCITFDLETIRPIGKTGQGVSGINCGMGEVIGACLCDEESSFVMFTKNGFGKRMDSDLVTVQHRGGKGITCYKVTPKTGELTSVRTLQNMNNVLIVGNTKSITIDSNSLPLLGRATSGVKVIKDKVKTSIVLGE